MQTLKLSLKLIFQPKVSIVHIKGHTIKVERDGIIDEDFDTGLARIHQDYDVVESSAEAQKRIISSDRPSTLVKQTKSTRKTVLPSMRRIPRQKENIQSQTIAR
jgi:hypothetical protein